LRLSQLPRESPLSYFSASARKVRQANEPGTSGLLKKDEVTGKVKDTGAETMFAAMLLAFSVVALAQFAVYYWRAILSGVARQPLSVHVLQAARMKDGALTGADFRTLVSLHNLTPDLQLGLRGLSVVRMYYAVIDGIRSMATTRAPQVAEWAERELATCARYVAVQMDRRLQANLAVAAALRSC